VLDVRRAGDVGIQSQALIVIPLGAIGNRGSDGRNRIRQSDRVTGVVQAQAAGGRDLHHRPAERARGRPSAEDHDGASSCHDGPGRKRVPHARPVGKRPAGDVQVGRGGIDDLHELILGGADGAVAVGVPAGSGHIGMDLVDDERLHLHVGGAGGVVGLTVHRRADIAGDAGQIKVVAHPVGGGAGVGAVRDARGAAGGEGEPVIRHAQGRHAVGQVRSAAVVDGYRVHDLGPGGGVEHAVVVRVQVVTQGAGEILHQEQGECAVFEGIGRERSQPEAIGVGGAHGDHLVHRPGGGAGEIALNLQQGQGGVIVVGLA